MKQVTFNTLAEFKNKIESRDLEMAKTIYESVKRGVIKNYKTVNIFNVTLREDPLNVYKFKLEKNQWTLALNTCMGIFSDNDMFEECIEIQKLLKELAKVDSIKELT